MNKNKMENVLDNIILKKLDIQDLKVFSKTSKKYSGLCGNIMKNIINNMFTPIVIDAVGMDNLVSADWLEWDDKYMGSTAYLDRFYPDEISSDYTIGVDSYGREFVILRTVVSEGISEGNSEGNLKTKESLITIFRRYADSNFFVISERGLALSKGRVSFNESLAKDVKTLSHEGKITMKHDDDYSCNVHMKHRYDVESLNRETS